jgi:hypothetical protein
MDYGEVLHFAFAWKANRRSLKYVAMVWLLHLLFLFALAGLAFFMFRDLGLSVLSGSYSSFAAMLSNPVSAGASAITFWLASLPLYFVFFLAAFYIRALVLLFGFGTASVSVPRFGPAQFFTLFFIELAMPFAALFSVYNRRMLLLPLAGIVFSIGAFFLNGPFAQGCLALAALLFTAYFFVFLYGLARLFFAGLFFLKSDCSLSMAFEESSTATRGKIRGIVLAFAAVAVVVGIASIIIILSLSLLWAFSASYFFAANFITSLSLALFAFAILLCPFQMLCYNFALVSICGQISARERECVMEKQGREEKAGKGKWAVQDEGEEKHGVRMRPKMRLREKFGKARGKRAKG